MSAKTHAAYQHDKMMYCLVGENCPSFFPADSTYEEYKETLDEISILIEHFQFLEDVEEVAYLRRVKMRIKMQMREMKQNIEAKTTVEEYTYS